MVVARTTQERTTVATEATAPADLTTSPPELAASSTVTVTVSDVEDSIGSELVGLVFSGSQPNPRFTVGGFGVAVDTDPFSTTQIVRSPRPDLRSDSFFPEEDWPYVTDDPALVEPGTYMLILWLGEPPLCCYSAPWVPALSPTLRGCGTTFTVEPDEDVTISVSGVPGEPGSGASDDAQCPTD